MPPRKKRRIIKSASPDLVEENIPVLSSAKPNSKTTGKKTNKMPPAERCRKNIRPTQKKQCTTKKTMPERNMKIENAQKLLEILKDEKLLNNRQYSFLLKKFGEVNAENEHFKLGQNSMHTEEMQEFATALYLSSPEVYSKLRHVIMLPEPTHIQTLAEQDDYKPGFLTSVIEQISELVARKGGVGSDCVLMLGDTPIAQQSVWDSREQCYVGYVNYGSDGPHPVDAKTLASEALVFYLVSLSDSWRYPIGFFFGNGSTAEVQASLVQKCLSHLDEKGFSVCAVVANGSPENLKMARILGCKLEKANFQSWFTTNTLDKVIYFIFDICYTMKALKDLLSSVKDFRAAIDGKIEEIHWHYIDFLCNVIQTGIFTSGDQLTWESINWKKCIMNVCLSKRTLSSPIADAIESLREDLQLTNFEGSDATVAFIRILDELFDVLNSQNPNGKYRKAALTTSNFVSRTKLFEACRNVFFGLKDFGDQIIIEDQNNSAIICLLTALSGVKEISKLLLTRSKLAVHYVLTHKFSLDHLEFFFDNIRQNGNWCGTPNQLQFKWALQKFLIKNQPSVSNKMDCSHIRVESRSLFTCFSSERISPVIDRPLDDFIDCASPENVGERHVLCSLDLLNGFTELQEECFHYIAGFLLQKMQHTINCEFCRENLFYSVNQTDLSPDNVLVSVPLPFVTSIEEGGTIYPSSSVLRVVKECERIFRISTVGEDQVLSDAKQWNLQMVNQVLQQLLPQQNLFPEFLNHMCDNGYLYEEDHRTQIVRCLSIRYFDLRSFTYVKRTY